MANLKKTTAPVSLESLISYAIQVPGVKVNRELFLRKQFEGESSEKMTEIIQRGPVLAGYTKGDLRRIAKKILTTRTSASTFASFVAGIPGGFAMIATIPADLLQFYGMALGMAQEIAYLYGEDDLWEGGHLDSEKVTNQLIL